MSNYLMHMKGLQLSFSVIAFIISMWTAPVSAVTCPPSGTISADCSWNLAGSPVSLGPVTISAGVTATVESDVVLQLSTEDINIYGTLDAYNGASIVATGNQNVSDIRVYSGGNFNLSSPATVTYAAGGRINVDVYGSAVLTGASLDVNNFSAYSGAACNISGTTIKAGKIAFYKGSDYVLSGNTLWGGVYVDSDGDGIFNDGDRSGIIGDYPCTGGNSENCDDNCANSPNTNQADANSNGIGDVCDSCSISPTIETVNATCMSELGQSDLSVTASDQCGGNLTYTWTPLNGGVIIGSGSSVQFDPPDSGPHPCPYQVEVKVLSDASGLEMTQVVDVYIKNAGDADGNGVVNLMDKLLVRQHYGQSEGDTNWDVRADVTCDGVVNLMDKLKVRQQYGQTNGCVCQ